MARVLIDYTKLPDKKNVSLVDISGLIVSKNPVIIQALALGSCIGVILWDSKNKIGAFSHCFLPDSGKQYENDKSGKFVNVAINRMIKLIIKKGGVRENLVAKLAGGASVLNYKQPMLNIGERNTDKAIETLKELGIKIVGKDIRKNYGRTVTFYVETGVVTIHTAGRKFSKKI